MAERGTSDVSIQEITDRADVGFGSFYNHFTSKSELFEAAVAEVLEEHGELLDQVTAGIDDPAEVFAVGVRATARLAEEQPAIAQVLVHAGLDYLLADDGLAPRALRDVERAVQHRAIRRDDTVPGRGQHDRLPDRLPPRPSARAPSHPPRRRR